MTIIDEPRFHFINCTALVQYGNMLGLNRKKPIYCKVMCRLPHCHCCVQTHGHCMEHHAWADSNRSSLVYWKLHLAADTRAIPGRLLARSLLPLFATDNSPNTILDERRLMAIVLTAGKLRWWLYQRGACAGDLLPKDGLPMRRSQRQSPSSTSTCICFRFRLSTSRTIPTKRHHQTLAF